MRLWLFSFLILAGCANTELTFQRLPDSPNTVTTDQRVHGFFWGILTLGSHELKLANCTPDKVVRYRTSYSELDMVFWLLTAGLYSPHQVSVSCAKLDSTSVLNR